MRHTGMAHYTPLTRHLYIVVVTATSRMESSNVQNGLLFPREKMDMHGIL